MTSLLIVVCIPSVHWHSVVALSLGKVERLEFCVCFPLFYNTQGVFIKLSISYAKSREHYTSFFSALNVFASGYCHEFVRHFKRQSFEKKKRG